MRSADTSTSPEAAPSDLDASSLASLLDPGVLHDPRGPQTEPMRPGGRLPAEPQRPRRNLLRGFVLLSCKAAVLLFLAWGLVFNVSEVRGSSMMPGIQDHDRILVDHLTYMVTSVSRGDVVVMRYPLDQRLDYLKRVVGLPGDEVLIEGGRVTINGDGWPEPYVASESVDPYTHLSITVRPGHYFVLGDNRLHSSDSREFGQVPFELIRGKVRARVWPPARLGTVN
ncbi:MAG: signal peptidase I [Planctomycetota bacterium]|jgi:signal peptidase I